MTQQQIAYTQINTDSVVTNVLASTFTGAANTNWQDTGLKVTLPSAGTWMVSCQVRVTNSTTASRYTDIRLFNETTSAEVADTIRLGPYPTASMQGTIPLTYPVVTTTINNIIRVESKRSAAEAYTVNSDTAGQTAMTAWRIS